MLRGLTCSLIRLALGALLALAACGTNLNLDLTTSAAAGSAGTGVGGSEAGGSDTGGSAGEESGAAGEAPGTCLLCASCTSDADCAKSKTQKLCNTDTAGSLAGMCVACLSDVDCPSDRKCDLVTLQCAAICTEKGAAACGSQGRQCDTTHAYCVECLSATDCGGKLLCNHECVECVENADCAAKGQLCWLQRHTCVDCRADSDCPTVGDVCTGKKVCSNIN